MIYWLNNVSVFFLLCGVWLYDDWVCGICVLLVFECVMQLDVVGDVILFELDGKCSVVEVILILCQCYQVFVEQIEGDVCDFLIGLVDWCMVYLFCVGVEL